MNRILVTSLKRWAAILLRKEYRIQWLVNLLSILLLPFAPYMNLTAFFEKVYKLMKISSNRLALQASLRSRFGELIIVRHADDFVIPVTLRARSENKVTFYLRARSEDPNPNQVYLRDRGYGFDRVDFIVELLEGSSISYAEIASIVDPVKVAGSVWALQRGRNLQVDGNHIDLPDEVM